MKQLLARIALGAVFAAAAWPKIKKPKLFATAIAAYGLVPGKLVGLTAATLPWLELVCAACLILGLFTRASAILVAGMALAFLSSGAYALAMGMHLKCGCFGGADTLSPAHLNFDLVLLVLAVGLTRTGAGRLGLDRFVEAQPVGEQPQE